MSITTLDEALAREMEPDVPNPQQRLRVVQELSRAGVPVSVAAAPILPGLTDGEQQLAELFEAAYDHGAEVAFHQTVHLYSATRVSLFEYLRRSQPHLLEPYQRAFAGDQNAPRAYRDMLRQRIEGIRERLEPRRPTSLHTAPSGGQLSLGI